MSHTAKVKTGPEPDSDTNEELFGAKPERLALMPMLDRSSPGWAGPLSWTFSIGIAVCLMGIFVLTVFLTGQAALAREPFMAVILVGVGVIPIVGLLIFEFAHAKALAGYRVFRERNTIVAQAFVAVVVFALLEMVHPLLGLAIPLGVGLNLLVMYCFRRMQAREPLWDFLPQEAVSVLAGRDEIGRNLIDGKTQDHTLVQGFLNASLWFSVIVSFGIGSWMAAQEILSPSAIAAVGLMTFWAVEASARYLRQRGQPNPLTIGLAASVKQLRMPPDPEAGPATGGLRVQGLTVVVPNQAPILSDVTFQVEPGQVLGLIGPPGAGKSILLKSLISPHDLAGLNVRGCVRLGETDLWERRAEQSSVPAYLLPSVPLILPTSGQNNLSFFQTGSALDQGKRILEQMVFASDLVEKICATPDATTLSGAEQKALAFARSFLVSPPLYLIDRPEDNGSEKMVGALVARIRQECRAGRSFVVVTENRALLDICDKLLILQEGRVIDFGPALEIRARQSSGWQRFVGARSLETEENLEAWIRSHFRRDGDEINRRKACIVCAELLAFSCQNVAPLSHQSVCFEFKHFEGHCEIKLMDRDIPVSSGVLQRAEEEARQNDGKTRLSPLAKVFETCSKVHATVEQDQRVVEAHLDTYDPRKSGGKPPADVLKADVGGGGAAHATTA